MTEDEKILRDELFREFPESKESYRRIQILSKIQNVFDRRNGEACDPYKDTHVSPHIGCILR